MLCDRHCRLSASWGDCDAGPAVRPTLQSATPMALMLSRGPHSAWASRDGLVVRRWSLAQRRSARRTGSLRWPWRSADESTLMRAPKSAEVLGLLRWSHCEPTAKGSRWLQVGRRLPKIARRWSRPALALARSKTAEPNRRPGSLPPLGLVPEGLASGVPTWFEVRWAVPATVRQGGGSRAVWLRRGWAGPVRRAPASQ